jgi:hypothetical protein
MENFGSLFFENLTYPILKDKKTKGDVKMEKIDTKLVSKLNNMIEEATQARNFKLANSLGSLQIQIIEERTNAWVKGYENGYKLAMREIELRKLKDKPVVQP